MAKLVLAAASWLSLPQNRLLLPGVSLCSGCHSNVWQDFRQDAVAMLDLCVPTVTVKGPFKTIRSSLTADT